MILYRRVETDLPKAVARCYFDADQGRIALAIERVRELDVEHPDNPHIVYAEGLLRREFLGQGLQARELFERAYNLAQFVPETRSFAARNALQLARTEEEWTEWVARDQEADPTNQRFHQTVQRLKDSLANGLGYLDFLAGNSEAAHQQGEFGYCAALLEITLAFGALDEAEEIGFRRMRAQSLRQLDIRSANIVRKSLKEHFAPKQRLALRAGIAELERAIGLDEWDAELWNLKAAWLVEMREFENALVAANRAIELRPEKYSKPWDNKALALKGLGRQDEAVVCTRASLAQAKAAGDEGDIAKARIISREISKPDMLNDWPTPHVAIPAILAAANETAEQELIREQQHYRAKPLQIIQRMINATIRRAEPLGPSWHMGCVRIVAELLTDYTPETVFRVLKGVSRRSSSLRKCFLRATVFVTGYSSGVLQRDAARLFVLALLDNNEISRMRDAYRRHILSVTAAAADELAQLETVVNAELDCFNPEFIEMIAVQERISDNECTRARTEVLDGFVGEIPEVPYPPNANMPVDPNASSARQLATMLGISEAEAVRTERGALGCASMITLTVLGWAVGWLTGYCFDIQWVHWVGLGLGLIVGQGTYHKILGAHID